MKIRMETNIIKNYKGNRITRNRRVRKMKQKLFL